MTHVPARLPDESDDAYGARVWAALEADPTFDERLRAGEADLAAGRGVLYEVRGRRLVRVRRPGRTRVRSEPAR